MKTCRKCGEEKPLDQFHTYVKADRPGRTYTRTECKDCSHEVRRSWGERNREHDNATKLAWQRHKYRTDPEWRGMRLAQRREWETGSPEYKASGRGVKVEHRPRAEMIDVGPVREAVEWSGITWGELAARVDMDPSSLKRALTQQATINTGTACRILEAIDSSPADVGL